MFFEPFPMYSIPVESGTQILTPSFENPAYFNISPATTSVTFPAASNPFTQDFCISANGVHNDLDVSLLPITAARPGFDATYKMVYKNKGTTVQSGTLNLNFDNGRIDFVSANPMVDSQIGNNLGWNFANLQPFETRTINVVLNINSSVEVPPVAGGDVLQYMASVVAGNDETPADNISDFYQTVVNSFDPNDKTCLEGATITPEMVGKEIHYMIRFENTGTANAENIVIKDMIDTAKFDISSLMPIDGSHPFVTRINGNKVEFIFQNINLPFDNANNDGYVAFKIKTKPTLVLGNTFSNTASIYFDYNAPIVTNTATTTIAALAKQDFEFKNYFRIYPNPADAVLNIDSKKQIAVSSISIYNTLGQLVIVVPNAENVATVDVSSLRSGNYFLKIISDKGTSSTKFIKN
ncbi:MAG: T9SS type A sorting domain-containing protein [Burkholderiales bacterium]|nr:T9SS type A sorting domain-containing protein [Flavobacterium sp.]